MLSFLAKAAFAGFMVALITLVAKRYPGWGGLLASLPLTSLLALGLLYAETGDRQRVGELSTSILWFIVPSLPLFFVLPALLRTGINFWVAFAVAVAMTLALYALTFWAAPRLGIKL
ncbi:MAG: DUF3147 family protein [Sphingomicrobium sp.]